MTRGSSLLYCGRLSPWRSPAVIAQVLQREGKVFNYLATSPAIEIGHAKKMQKATASTFISSSQCIHFDQGISNSEGCGAGMVAIGDDEIHC